MRLLIPKSSLLLRSNNTILKKRKKKNLTNKKTLIKKLKKLTTDEPDRRMKRETNEQIVERMKADDQKRVIARNREQQIMNDKKGMAKSIINQMIDTVGATEGDGLLAGKAPNAGFNQLSSIVNKGKKKKKYIRI